MTKLDANLTSIAAWAATEGISRQAAHEAVRRCGIPLQDGRVDPAVASALYRARTRKRARTRPVRADAPADESISYDEARRRSAVAQAKMDEADMAERLGELVKTEHVTRLCAAHYLAAREIAMNLPARLSPVLAAETDERTVYHLLLEEMRRFLEEVAGVERDLEAYERERQAKAG